jgi:hypothetical protein
VLFAADGDGSNSHGGLLRTAAPRADRDGSFGQEPSQEVQPECVAKKRCGDGELQKLEPKRKQLDADGRTQARLPKKAAKDTPAIRQYTVTLGLPESQQREADAGYKHI